MHIGIAAIADYLPLLRSERKFAAQELAWSGLSMPRVGLRAVAGWREDSLTMAVEAARTLLFSEPASAPTALRFVSTSLTLPIARRALHPRYRHDRSPGPGNLAGMRRSENRAGAAVAGRMCRAGVRMLEGGGAQVVRVSRIYESTSQIQQTIIAKALLREAGLKI